MIRCDVAIVGGGLIGSSIAFHLAQRGIRPVVCERRSIAAEASGANAGALWPQGELSTPSPYLELALASFDRFPRLAEELAALTGVDIEFQWSGLLDVIPARREYQAIESALGWRRDMELDFELMSRANVCRFEPALSSDIAGGLFFPKEGDVNPMALNNAYMIGAQRLGARLLLGANVVGVDMQRGRVRGLQTSSGPIAADIVVNAAGAWSPVIGGMVGVSVPVRPVRGQIMVTEMLPPLISHCIVGAHTYLVPKAKGNIVIGATQEEVGYHKAMTVSGLSSLAADATALVPALGRVSIVRTWCGLRPGSIDEWPVLGPAPGVEGMLLATGHFRNGCLLSPITGQLIAEYIVDGRPSISLRPFALERISNIEL
jgi:glycine oxidase